MRNPREAALVTLYEIEFDGKYSNMAIKTALTPDMSSIDKAFATTLIYGVLRRKITLDYIISKYSKIKLKKLSKFVLMILRMGIFQIYYLDKVPDSAAVNESVKLAKHYCSKSSGFINGILHAVIKGRDELEFPKEYDEYLSIKYSFPPELVEIFKEYEFCEELLEALNTEPKTTLRINSLKNDSLELPGAEVEQSPLYAYALEVKGLDVGNSAEYRTGKFIAQDVAAMMAAYALAPQSGDFCIDMCAAPGGKTTHMAELMKNEGRILAFDVHLHKIDIISKNAARMGIDIIEAQCRDAMEADSELLGKADKVLADVPCSGLGIIRRKPDIKWTKEDISALPDIQYRILENAAKYLKVGGELVYSTCTLNKRENEGVVCKFIKENPEFEFVRVKLSDALDRENDGYVTLFPNIDGTDGFFISKIKRCK